MKVSVVVPTLNEQDYLPGCLKDLSNQTHECEIIVVDSGSSDRTVEIARSQADRVLHGRKNIAFNRQLGLQEASGDIYVSTDADCRFEKDWIGKIVKRFENPEVVGVSGPTIPLPSDSVFLDKACYFAGNLSLGLLHKLGVVWFRGSNSAYRRELVLGLGGYDTTVLAREDSKLSQKVSKEGVTVFDWNITVMTYMRRREETGWLKTLKYYVDTPVSLLTGKTYYEKV